MSALLPLLGLTALLAFARKGPAQGHSPSPAKKKPVGKADVETHEVLRAKKPGGEATKKPSGEKPGPSESDQALAEKLARMAFEKEKSREGAGKGAESAPTPKPAPSPVSKKPATDQAKPKGASKPAPKPAPPAPKPAAGPPKGFDRALAKKTSKEVANHIKGKKGNYSREVLKLWQVRAGIPPDGIYGKGSYAALKYYAGNLAPAPLFNQGTESYPWKE